MFNGGMFYAPFGVTAKRVAHSLVIPDSGADCEENHVNATFIRDDACVKFRRNSPQAGYEFTTRGNFSPRIVLRSTVIIILLRRYALHDGDALCYYKRHYVIGFKLRGYSR